MGWSQGGYISAFLTDLVRAVRGDLGRRRHLELGDLLLQHRHHAVHDQLPRRRPGRRSGDLRKDVADALHQAGEDADADPARRDRSPRADRRMRTSCGRGCEDRGVPVEMVVYKGFGHGITKPKAMRAVMQHNLRGSTTTCSGTRNPTWRCCRRSRSRTQKAYGGSPAKHMKRAISADPGSSYRRA